jgi:hypothetical protein
VSTVFAYPRRVLLADYARASAGLGFAAAVLFLPMHWVLALVFGGIALLLLGFGLRTGLRQLSRVEVTESGIAISGPLPRRIAWADLAEFRLRYFAMRRDRKHGWMELTLKSKAARLSIESQIEGFPTIVERAARAAAALSLDEASLVNLGALGIALPKRRRDPT